MSDTPIATFSGDPGRSLCSEIQQLREQQQQLCTALRMLVDVIREKVGEGQTTSHQQENQPPASAVGS